MDDNKPNATAFIEDVLLPWLSEGIFLNGYMAESGRDVLEQTKDFIQSRKGEWAQE